MDFFAPIYYTSFRCIADKCRHSCCIGWDIPIDGKAFELYNSSTAPAVRMLRERIVDINGELYIGMNEDGRCPMLTRSGLCSLISELGDAALCQTCRRHPRFINVVGNRCEVGLGISCEAACELVLLSDKPHSLLNIPELSREWCEVAGDEGDEPLPYTAIEDRDAAILTVENSSTLAEALRRLSDKYSVSTDIHTDDEWIDIFLGLECLDPEWRNTLLQMPCAKASDFPEKELILKNLLKYLIYRHTAEAEYYDDFRARLGFCMLGAYIVELLISCCGVSDKYGALEIARKYSSETEYSETNTDELIFEFECRI
ncbi:MAG: flagellin lysine-N-methylase [Clostridia bacterium]|nr:flagellin lysine-N-methylase [Clostridia bacterium]